MPHGTNSGEIATGALPRVGISVLLADPETRQNQFDDVSEALTPEERLWAVLFRASGRHGGAYADSVPRWAWNLIKADKPNLDCLKCAFERYVRDKSANSDYATGVAYPDRK